MKRTYKFRTFECPDQHKTHKFVEVGEEWVLCEHSGCSFAATLPHNLVGASSAVHGDEIDYVDHNLGQEPIRIRSKAQRRALMAATGRVEFIRHTPVPGTDKSPYTTDWSKGSIDPQTLENARVLVERQGGIRYTEEAPIEPVANEFRGVGDGNLNKILKEIDAYVRSTSR